MKKLLGIVVLGLLLSGNAYADGSNLKKTLLNSNLVLKYSGDGSMHTIKFKKNGTATWTSGEIFTKNIWQVLDDKTFSIYDPKAVKGKSLPQINIDFNDMIASFVWDGINYNYEIISPKKLIGGTQSAGISFTIKDKKEQCAAIGFKPATDKFADCVLRLVELDLKKQINNPTIVAQDSGNQAIVDELKRSNNMQQSQFLMNLSNQLLNPSSPASSMSSSSCTVRGGTIKTINCW